MGKSTEVVEVMNRRRVNIMCLQETRWIGEGARGLILGYKAWYVVQETSHMTRNGGARNGVNVILDERLLKEVIEVYQKNDRLIRVKLLCGKEIVNVISTYTSQVGLDAEEKRHFWEDLDEVVQGVLHLEKLNIGGDLNGHVGASRDGYESVHGGFGYGQRDAGGEVIMDFSQSYDLILANTWFKKRDSHLITFRS
ncbi:craniofacial development protein 2-like [Chenopodium quinoa]|uniref:craniofacial development protein 2-like n=1 Tax=Chenopodium quinoa TaxID=63459 RepID=UPI000B796B84|nr:craniofacial development protein 2-like [Chenopodium quinoa]